MTLLKKEAPVLAERELSANRSFPPSNTLYSYYSTGNQQNGFGLKSGNEQAVTDSQGGILADLYGWWGHRNSADKVDRRRPAWLRPHYLDLCTWTKQNSEFSYKYEDLEKRLRGCSRTWRGPKQGDKRPVGCGDRVACPVCADYYHGTMAREATSHVDAILAAFESLGYGVKCKDSWPYTQAWGHHLTFTLPKEFSEKLDNLLLFESPEQAKDLISKLRAGVWRVVNRTAQHICEERGLPKPGKLGALMVLHFWQSSAPWEPHYHFHVYLMPFVESGNVEIEDIFRWNKSLDDCMWSNETQEFMRKKWKKAAERILGMKYPGEWDVKHVFVADGKDDINGELKKARKAYKAAKLRGESDSVLRLLHKAMSRIEESLPDVTGRERVGRLIAYQMRAPLRDVWKGVRKDVNTDEFYYVGRKGKRREFTWENMERVVGRVEAVRENVKAVSWLGYLSNVRNKEVNLMLGLQFEEKRERESRPDDDYWTPVTSNSEGVLFKNSEDDFDFTPWENLDSRPVGDIGCPPIGKKRTRCWYFPGAEDKQRKTARAGPLIVKAG